MAESRLFLSDTKPRSCLILFLDIPSEMSFSEARRISRETRSLMERTESESKAGTDAAVFFLNAGLCRKNNASTARAMTTTTTAINIPETFLPDIAAASFTTIPLCSETLSLSNMTIPCILFFKLSYGVLSDSYIIDALLSPEG